jgi:hypothetical protein
LSVYPHAGIGLGHERVWREIAPALESLELVIEGVPTRFQADWAELARRELVIDWSDQALMTDAERQGCVSLEDLLAFPGIDVAVTSPDQALGHQQRAIEYYLATVFLAANLAAPGSMVFFGAGIVHDTDVPSFGGGVPWLDGEWMGAGWQAALDRDWPAIANLSFSTTLQWLSQKSLTGSADSSCGTQRALYALLRAVGMGGLPGPIHLFWLACALEAIADTPPMGIGTILSRRMIQALGAQRDSARRVKKCFSQFYDLRSRVVHGDYGVLHPAADESSGPAYDREVDRFAEQVDFGISVVTAALQVLVVNGWTEFVFEERVHGRE